MKKVFAFLLVVFMAVFLSLYFGVFDQYIPVKADEQTSGQADENILHEKHHEQEAESVDEEKESSPQQDEGTAAYEEYKDQEYIRADVVYIVDGDTIFVKTTERPDGFKVRYIGIDTPESVHPDDEKNTEEGKIASEKNKEIIENVGSTVYLEYDVQQSDKYGRDLCYVYIKEGSEYQMVQEILLAEGMCQTMTIQPNSKYAERFLKIQETAREAGKGFWDNNFF